MAQAIGLGTIFGVSAFESTYGTAATIDRRLEIVTDTIQRQQNVQESEGISGDLSFARKSARRTLITHKAAGSTTHELAKTGLGIIFNAMTGGTSTIAQQASTTAYLQTHTVGGMAGKSLTIQRALRDSGGTQVMPVTHLGCKVASWELTVSSESIPQLTITWDCQQEVKSVASTTLVGLSAPAGSNFSYQGVSVTLGGATVDDAFDLTLSCENPMSTDRFGLGTSNLQREPDRNAFINFTGTLTADFTNTADFYDRFVADTGVPLVATFTGDEIESPYDEELKITVPKVHLTGSTPTTSGPDLLQIDGPFTAAHDGTNSLYTIEYTSTDTTI